MSTDAEERLITAEELKEVRSFRRLLAGNGCVWHPRLAEKRHPSGDEGSDRRQRERRKKKKKPQIPSPVR